MQYFAFYGPDSNLILVILNDAPSSAQSHNLRLLMTRLEIILRFLIATTSNQLSAGSTV